MPREPFDGGGAEEAEGAEAEAPVAAAAAATAAATAATAAPVPGGVGAPQGFYYQAGRAEGAAGGSKPGTSHTCISHKHFIFKTIRTFSPLQVVRMSVYSGSALVKEAREKIP